VNGAAADGCPTVKRVIELRLDPSRRLVGQVRSVDPSYAQCPEQLIRIQREYDGRMQVVATAPVATPGSFRVRIEHRRGLYIAELRDQVTGPSGHCLPARSEAVDTSGPKSTVTKQPKAKIRTMRKKAKVTVEFASEDAGATFECKLDKSAYAPCTSPYSVSARAKRGKGKKHTISIKAEDDMGNIGEPVTVGFRVIRKG
jgi:hypothetical protein